MLVLKIIGIVLAAVLLLVTVILLLPVDILLLADGKNGFRILARFLWMIFGEEPKKGNPIVEALKRSLGIAHLNSAETIRSTVEEHGASVTLRETVDILLQLVERVFWLLRRCRVPRFRVTALCGGEDAAMEYGVTNAVLHPLLQYLTVQFRLRPRNVGLDIRCDFSREESEFEIDIILRVRVLYLLRAFLHIIRKNVEKELLQAEQAERSSVNGTESEQ